MRLFTIILLFSLCQITLLRAQSKERAEKLFQKSIQYKASQQNQKAIQTAYQALLEFRDLPDVYYKIAQWYKEEHNYQKVASIYAEAALYCKTNNQKFASLAAQNYLLALKPDSSIYYLNAFGLQDLESKNLRTRANTTRNLKLSQTRDTIQARKFSFRINSPYPEFFPRYSADGKRLYFTRRINGVNEDFYYSEPDTCGDWFWASNLGYPPNTAAQESAMFISADDHYLFFMRSDNRSENGWGRGGCDLYMAYRVHTDSAWSDAESFGATINTPAFEGMPSLSSDLKDLYFVSNRPGGYGGLDIWVSHFQMGVWQMPINLGPEINTAKDESAPFIAADGQTLFFASEGHKGFGAIDLFSAKKINDTTWTLPHNLGLPINSSANDHSIYVAENGKSILFASDRNNQAGDLDLYESSLPRYSQIESRAFAKIYIKDSLSNSPAPMASITLLDSIGNTLGQYHANKGDGSLVLSFPIGRAVQYQVKAFGFHTQEGSIQFPEACEKWCEMDFLLIPKNYIRPTKDSLIYLLHFSKNTVQITDSIKNEMIERIKPFIEKPNLSIYINSYTDNSGTPILNIEKSTQRANAVADALKALNLSTEQLFVNGYGEENPIAPNDTEENKDLNRRVELLVKWSD